MPLAIIVARRRACSASCIERLGLVVSLVVVTAVTALASRESKPLEVAALALGLAVFSLGVFVYALAAAAAGLAGALTG